MAALYLNHPYGHPVIGWHQEIEKLNREDALAFYKRFYAPNNATLVIAGDVEAAGMSARWWSRPSVKLAAQPAISGAAPSPAGADAGSISHRHAVRRPSRTTGHAALLSGSFRHHGRSAGESPALDVLAQLMGSGSNSYLYRALVLDRALAVTASAGYQRQFTRRRRSSRSRRRRNPASISRKSSRSSTA